MKRKFLEDFGIEKETIDKIMAENASPTSYPISYAYFLKVLKKSFEFF